MVRAPPTTLPPSLPPSLRPTFPPSLPPAPQVCNRKDLAYVSKRPGKTQQFNYFLVNDKTKSTFYMVDIPGIGYAKVREGGREEGREGGREGWRCL